jgi:hypothetical protein
VNTERDRIQVDAGSQAKLLGNPSLSAIEMFWGGWRNCQSKDLQRLRLALVTCTMIMWTLRLMQTMKRLRMLLPPLVLLLRRQ